MRLLVVAAAVALVPMAAAAQLDEVVARTEDGVVRFGYAARAGVEICEDGVRYHGRRISWRSGDDEASAGCRAGPIVVDVRVRGGAVRRVEIVTGSEGRERRADVDLGTIASTEATAFLLSLPYAGTGSDAAKDALLPAMLADVGEVWRDLLGIARDRGLDADVRRSALFWLGQEAAAAATEGLAEMVADRDEEQEIRNAAIFALSQRPADEGVPILMEIAGSADEAETRRQAMFWLAQSEAPGVVEFFEAILLGQSR